MGKTETEKQHRPTWLHSQRFVVGEEMNAVFPSNFSAYIVCQHKKLYESLGFAWTGYLCIM